MSKRNIAIISTLVLILGGGIVTTFIVSNFNSKKIEDSSAKQVNGDLPNPTSKSTAADKKYEDASGFSFMYPAEFSVEDKTPADPKFYTQLNVKVGGGEVILKAFDTTYKTPDDWLKKDKSAPKEASASGAVKLGGLSAKEYQNSDSSFTIAIDSGVLYIVESPLRDEGLKMAHERIVETFAFAGTEQPATTATTNEIIYEEEIVE